MQSNVVGVQMEGKEQTENREGAEGGPEAAGGEFRAREGCTA